MKKWVGYILSFYILFCSIVPCTIIDDCEQDEYITQTVHDNEEKDCNSCSPFSTCASTPGFTLNAIAAMLDPIIFYNARSYSDYHFSSKSGYYPTPFQPPKAGIII